MTLRVVPLRLLAARVLVLSSFIAVFPAALVGHSAFAQRGPAQRIVQGKVTDKGDAGLRGAVVYLKDDHTLAVKSYISDDKGDFRFGQLSQNTDYELWAESSGKKSPVKTISSFDNKNEFTINLKVDTGK